MFIKSYGNMAELGDAQDSQPSYFKGPVLFFLGLSFKVTF